MAELLNFDTGLVTFSINGKSDVTFNPTDSAFVEHISQVFEKLDELQDKYSEGVRNMETGKIFDFARESNDEMRKLIDGIFEHPICDDVFGDMNVYAYASGLPVWANLLMAIIDTINNAFDSEQKLTSKRIEKYTAKYRKKK
jgi:hypothetical protein